jgi:hypothetical protein
MKSNAVRKGLPVPSFAVVPIFTDCLAILYFFYSSVASAVNVVESAKYNVSSADKINVPAQQDGAEALGITLVNAPLSPNSVVQYIFPQLIVFAIY